MENRQVILVVDDNESILQLLRVSLSLEGYQVVTASNGISALALMEECEPDLVVLDIIMPGLDGLQVLDRIRQRCNVPVIMLTAKCENTVLRDALGLGADDYVRKPFGIEVLLARIKAKLRRTRQMAGSTSRN